jgi:hypothetical protein
MAKADACHFGFYIALLSSYLCFLPQLFKLFGITSREHLPIHVHVRNADRDAKFRIDPVELLENHGMKTKDLKLAESAIIENEDLIVLRWNEHFKDQN